MTIDLSLNESTLQIDEVNVIEDKKKELFYENKFINIPINILMSKYRNH